MPAKRSFLDPGVLLASLAVLGAVAFWAWAGRWYSDEGWYLWCGKLAVEGKAPYRDFLFTQPPFVLYLYGAAMEWIAPRIAVGRIVSAVLAASAAWIVLALAFRMYGRRAPWLTAAIVGSSSFTMFHLVVAKGYAAGALCLAGGCYLLVTGSGRGVLASAAAGALFAGAALVRASAALVVAVAVGWEALSARRLGHALSAAAAAAAVLAAAIVPFLVLDARNFVFGVWSYHRVSWMHAGKPFAEFLSRFWPAMVLAATTVAVGARRGRGGLRDVFLEPRGARLVLLVAGLLSVAHLFLGAHASEYHSLTYPLVALLLAGWTLRAWDGEPRRWARGALAAAVAACAAGGLLAAPGWTWLAGNWHPDPDDALATTVREVTAPGEPILCMDPEVFLFTGRPGVPGTEMGIFDVMFDYRRGDWRPTGSFTEEDYLSRLDSRAQRVVVITWGDVELLASASRRRTGRRDFANRLVAALTSGYERRLETASRSDGKSRIVYEVWVRREP